MRFGSLCSGIEAASVAFEPLGWTAAWFSEIEPFCRALLSYRFPKTLNHGDMMTLPARIRSGEVEAPELLCGGTPCQAFSLAGNRKSLADARGNLTLTFCEVANAIDDVRRAEGKSECIILWENVPGVLNTKDNALGCFLAELAGESVPLEPPGGRWTDAGCIVGPQRTIAWRCLDAQYFGLAQRRKRVFVVASARKDFDPIAVLFEFDGVRRDSAPSREAGEETTSDAAESVAGSLRATDGGADIDHARAGHLVEQRATWWDGGGISQTLDAVLYKGQTMPEKNRFPAVLQPAAYGFQTRIARNGRGDMGDLVSALNAQSGQTGKGDSAPCVAIGFPANLSGTQCASAENIAPAMGAKNPTAVAFKPSHFTRGKDGAPSDIVPPLTKEADRGDQEAVVLFAADVAPTLMARGNSTGGDRPPGTCVDTAISNVVMSTMQVRRLMPMECERLQGFPDSWTFVPSWSGWRNMGVDETPESCVAEALEVKQNKKTGKWRVKDADGPRYKAIGNSWAVPVVRWIGERIQKQLP